MHQCSKNTNCILVSDLIECKQFYSLTEFSSVILTGVYIPPQAPSGAKHNNCWLSIFLYVENAQINSAILVMVDFNSCSLSHELLRYKQCSKQNPLYLPIKCTYIKCTYKEGQPSRTTMRRWTTEAMDVL